MYKNGIKINFNKCNKLYVDQKVPVELITRDVGKIKVQPNPDFSVNEN